jgi:hypothetical protein
MPRQPRKPNRTPCEKIEDAFLDLSLEDQATVLERLRKDHAVCKRERSRKIVELIPDLIPEEPAQPLLDPHGDTKWSDES